MYQEQGHFFDTQSRGETQNRVCLFEGFMDFLSYLTLKQTDDSVICINAPCDHLIMNSISNLKKTLTYLQNTRISTVTLTMTLPDKRQWKP